MSARILVATSPPAARRIERALAGESLCVVRTLDEATAVLRSEAFRLAIFGLYFDDSRMFDLLPVARASALNRLTPILCINAIPGRLTPAALRGIRETVAAMGCEWLDVATIGDDEAGTALLGQALLAHLPAQPATPAAGSTAPVYASPVKDEPA